MIFNKKVVLSDLEIGIIIMYLTKRKPPKATMAAEKGPHLK